MSSLRDETWEGGKRHGSGGRVPQSRRHPQPRQAQGSSQPAHLDAEGFQATLDVLQQKDIKQGAGVVPLPPLGLWGLLQPRGVVVGNSPLQSRGHRGCQVAPIFRVRGNEMYGGQGEQAGAALSRFQS